MAGPLDEFINGSGDVLCSSRAMAKFLEEIRSLTYGMALYMALSLFAISIIMALPHWVAEMTRQLKAPSAVQTSKDTVKRRKYYVKHSESENDDASTVTTKEGDH